MSDGTAHLRRHCSVGADFRLPLGLSSKIPVPIKDEVRPESLSDIGSDTTGLWCEVILCKEITSFAARLSDVLKYVSAEMSYFEAKSALNKIPRRWPSHAPTGTGLLNYPPFSKVVQIRKRRMSGEALEEKDGFQILVC